MSWVMQREKLNWPEPPLTLQWLPAGGASCRRDLSFSYKQFKKCFVSVLQMERHELKTNTEWFTPTTSGSSSRRSFTTANTSPSEGRRSLPRHSVCQRDRYTKAKCFVLLLRKTTEIFDCPFKLTRWFFALTLCQNIDFVKYEENNWDSPLF